MNAEKHAPQLGDLVSVGDTDIHVVTLGPRDSAKPPVILIHGASANLRDMKMALGDALAKDRFVVLVDRPGRGYSERPEEGYRLETQAILIKGVADALGVEQPVVVGQSFGGAVALRYGLDFQDETRALVLLAPVSHEWPGGVAWYNQVSGAPIIGPLFRRLVAPVYGGLVASGMAEKAFAPNEAPDDYFEKSGMALLFRSSDFKANAADLRHLKEEIRGQQSRYQELRLPVEIVTGTADSTVSPDIHSKTLAREIETANLTLLPETGHALHHVRSEKILAIIDAASMRSN